MYQKWPRLNAWITSRESFPEAKPQQFLIDDLMPHVWDGRELAPNQLKSAGSKNDKLIIYFTASLGQNSTYFGKKFSIKM